MTWSPDANVRSTTRTQQDVRAMAQSVLFHGGMARSGDEAARAAQRRARRRTQVLRETHRRAVEMARNLPRWDARCHGGIEQPGPVEMSGQATRTHQVGGRFQVVLRDHLAAQGVLEEPA